MGRQPDFNRTVPASGWCQGHTPDTKSRSDIRSWYGGHINRPVDAGTVSKPAQDRFPRPLVKIAVQRLGPEPACVQGVGQFGNT